MGLPPAPAHGAPPCVTEFNRPPRLHHVVGLRQLGLDQALGKSAHNPPSILTRQRHNTLSIQGSSLEMSNGSSIRFLLGVRVPGHASAMKILGIIFTRVIS